MSVIIRLQNLPWSANALDIRQYFRGLSIPEGGVHIVGGELGDAFIAFSTDEDARQAFQLNNGKIKDIQINLLLSSRTEMQKVIEAARTAQTTPFMQTVAPAVIPPVSLITSSAQDLKKEDGKESKSRERDDSKSRRGRDRRRSRSRTRSRDRKDRSRDRRDRKRRDRTRSRERKDRRRDRRGRSRSRTRSRDRDSRRGKDDKKDIKTDGKLSDNGGNGKKEDAKVPVRVWEQKVNMTTDNKTPVVTGLLGNFPAPPASLEEARRSLGIITGLQTNISPQMNDNNIRFQRNDTNNLMGGNNNWPRNNRFPDNRNQMPNDVSLHGNSMTPNLQLRPGLNQNMNLNMNQNMNPNLGMPGMDFRPHMFNQSGLRMHISQDNNFGMNAMHMNRPFLNRPGTTFPDQFGNQDRNMQLQQPQFMNNNRNDDAFRNDTKINAFKAEFCVQLRPYFGGYGEVRKFFHGLFINNTGLKFVTDVSGKRNGIVFVRFVRPDGKEQALNRSGMLLRGVPVEVLHLDDEEFERHGDCENTNNEECQESRNDPDHSSPRLQRFTCFLMDDLPEFVKEHDILKLFSDYAILSIHMHVNKQYRPIAYVQFVKEDEAAKALADKKLHVLAAKPVTITPLSKEVFDDAIRKQLNGDLVMDDNSYQSQNDTLSSTGHDSDNFQGNGPPKIITDCVLLTGMPHKTTERDVIDFFSDIGLIPVRIHMLLGKFGPSGECYCEFKNPDEAVCALDKNGMPLGTGTVRVELFLRKEMERNLGLVPLNVSLNPRFQGRFGPRVPNMMSGPRPPLNMMNRRPPRPNSRYDGPVDQMGPAGCVLNMENVPFKAGVNEILDFFEQFELSSQNVFRRFNDNGTPTGDARVTFNSASDAHRALEECNQLKMRDRTVFLRIL